MQRIHDHSVKKNLESYGWFWVGYDMNESEDPKPMTLKQANYIAARVGGFVVKFPEGI